MSWLTDFFRPKLNALMRKNEIPENLWHKCPKCEQMLFHRELIENLRVCRHCQHHLRLGIKERLESLFDEGHYHTYPLPPVPQDPLKFKDTKKYADRLKDAKQKTQAQEAIVVAKGTVGGLPLVVAAFDFSFIGGSMGIAVGEGLLKGAEVACETGSPFLVIPASGGARMQEGIFSLMQMARSTVAVRRVKEAGLPYLTLLTDPTTGGVSASFAMLGDIAIAEPGAVIGFAGARVIQETIRATLPPGFQSAEFQLDHGMVDMVIHRHQLKEKLAQLLKLLTLPQTARPSLMVEALR